MYSDFIHFWETAELLETPRNPWEFVQIGNCGSPLETPEGWLLLTHGVGPMRRYCIGAMLLDLDDPRKVIGSLDEPLIMPTEEEREGYVPNRGLHMWRDDPWRLPVHSLRDSRQGHKHGPTYHWNLCSNGSSTRNDRWRPRPVDWL